MGHCFNVFTLKLDHLSNSALSYALRFIFHVPGVNVFLHYLPQPFVLRLDIWWRFWTTCSVYPLVVFKKPLRAKAGAGKETKQAS